MFMKKVICLFLALCLSFCLFGCEKKYNKFTDYSFDYFDTATSIIGFEKDEKVFKNNCEKIKAQLEEYHKLYTIYSRYNDVNNLYAINHSDIPLEVDSKIIDMLKFSKEMYNLTGSKANIAMGSVLSIWHNYRNNGLENPSNAKLPPMSELKKAAQHTDINNIQIDGNVVSLKDSEMSLDVGAIAKGYATEQIALWMKNQGITGYLLNVGGNIRVVGNRPDGEKWQIGLENPDTENEAEPYTEYLELNEISLVTSGTYQRFYTVDGNNYHHIIDPETLMPATGYKMISVLNKSSAVADALSTALFCMDYEEGLKLVNSLDNTYVLWVMENGEKHYSKGFKDFIKE